MSLRANDGRQFLSAHQRGGDGVIDCGGDPDPAAYAVVLDAQRERVEDLSLHVGGGAAQSVAQVRKPIQVLGQPCVIGRQLWPERRERGNEWRTLGLQLVDADLDEHGIDSGLETSHLCRERQVHVGDPPRQSRAGLMVGVAAGLSVDLLGEPVHSRGAEHSLLEEAEDQRHERVLADAAPLTVVLDPRGRRPPVLATVVAAHINVVAGVEDLKRVVGSLAALAEEVDASLDGPA